MPPLPAVTPVPEDHMDLRSYLAIIRKYLPVIVACTLLGLLGGLARYTLSPKAYAADVQFYVSTPVPEGGSAQSVGQFATGRMTSYVELLSSQELGSRVAKAANVELTGSQVAKRITADTTVDSVLLKATITDSDPQRALQIAEGVAKVFGPMVDQLDNAGRKVPVVKINTVSAPSLHDGPVAPKLKTSLALGLGLGLALSVGFALVRELLDTSVRSPGAARELGGVPLIGTIPDDRAVRRHEVLTGDLRHSARAEAHRQLRTNLAFVDAGQGAQVLAFVAPSGQGATSTVAANTALSFAEASERVCFVEANLRETVAIDGMGVDDHNGLSTVLAGASDLESVVRPSATDPRIDVLPAGQLPPNPAELLTSPRFTQLVEQLRSRYDRVVVDAPGLLDVAEAAVLAKTADAVVLVVQQGRTSTQELEAARDALSTVGARVVGLVLNRARASRGRSRARRG